MSCLEWWIGQRNKLGINKFWLRGAAPMMGITSGRSVAPSQLLKSRDLIENQSKVGSPVELSNKYSGEEC
jgi:hypothetical protein